MLKLPTAIFNRVKFGETEENAADHPKLPFAKLGVIAVLASISSACTVNIVDIEGRDSNVHQPKLSAKKVISDNMWLEANARHNEADIDQSLANSEAIISETGFFLGPRDVSYDIKLDGINALFGYDFHSYGRTKFGALIGLEYNQIDILVSDQTRDFTIEEELYLFVLGLGFDTWMTDQWAHRLRLTSSVNVGDTDDRILRGEISILYKPVSNAQIEAGWHWTDYELDSQFLSDIDFRLSGPMLGASYVF